MADARAFAQDIFISYAHDDNLPLMEGDKGWVSEFHQTLEALVKQISGEDIHIWRDPKLQGNDFFADTLEQSLPQSAVLVSIVSPRYLNSEWCIRELAYFCQGAEQQGGVRVADKSRIFKVVKTQTPIEKQPSPLDQLLGYEFYHVDPQSGKPVEFRKEFGPEGRQKYITKLYDTAYEITDLLRELHQQGAASPTVSDSAPIYLAETTSDLQEERDLIKAELRQQGYSVLPDEPLPLSGGGFAAAVQGYLERSCLAVHLIGAKPGIVPEDERRSAIRLQNDIAAQISQQRGLPRIIWIPPNTAAAQEGRGRLIEVLEVDAQAQWGADLLKTGLEELKNVIQDRLREQEQAAQADERQAGEQQELIKVYLICDQGDFDATQPLADYLFDAGYELLYPVFDGDESERREDHVDKMATSDVAIIYCGSATDLWLSAKLRDLRKLPAYREGRAEIIAAVCMGAPLTPQKKRFRTHQALVLRLEDDFSPDQISPLTAAIAQRFPRAGQ